jgi:flavin reductase (DIM6/NTAB) family NADH-FMN oxidoreductase RutF
MANTRLRGDEHVNETGTTPFDEDVFDAMMASLDSPLAIVTTAAQDERAGCVVGFHSQCSISPRRAVIWLSKANYTYRVGLHAEFFAVHWLTESDHDIATLFGTETGDEVDKFEQCEWRVGPGDVPLLQACPNYLLGRRVALLAESSDHVCMVLEPLEVAGGTFRPLRLSSVPDLTAGHTVDERPIPPTQRAARTTG